MRRLVVDASAIGTLVLNEEMGDRVDALETALRDDSLIAAAHLPLEVAALLVKAERRQRIRPVDREMRLSRVENLLGRAVPQPAATSRTVFDLAIATGLTAYDAVYLELALRLDATLATNDDALLAAAQERGVPVLTTRA